MIENITSSDLKKNKELSSSFLNAQLNELKLNCNIFSGEFYSDSYNYFIINKQFKVFKNLFIRDSNQNLEHFFTIEFYNKFKNNIDNFKEFKDVFVLGSNAGNNYYSNLLQFLPRIFFLNEKQVKIAIHRNSSTKFREFIKLILGSKKINFTFVYLDDGFYKFTNCKIPEFFNLKKSIKILNSLLINNKSSKDRKIYITREDASYRKIINESDIVPILRSKGYKVINPQLYSIAEQINIFTNADKIIAPHGSNLANIIFCKPKTEIYEIGPNFRNNYEKFFENKYKTLAHIKNLKYYKFLADTVPVQTHLNSAKKYINKMILDNSNYYKNLIVKVKDIKKIV